MKNKKKRLSTNKFIFITGLTRCGKTGLIPLISSMKNCEQFFFNTITENLFIFNYLKLIDDKISKKLIISALNEEVFDKIYGRNLNNRINDLTNIKKYKGDVNYKKRMMMNKSNSFEKKVLKKNYFPILFHEGLVNLKLFENIFDKTKIINISRHPVDIVNSWIKKEYVDRYFETPKSNVIMINYKNKILPFFLKGSENKLKFCKSKEDKIVLMQSNLKILFEKNYRLSKKKNSIILIKFDDIILDTKEVLKKISKKFKLKLSSNLDQAMRDQKFPRKIDYLNRSKIKKKIFKNLSPKFRDILKNMIYQYENKTKVF
tara:strand:+ start:1972 stop:2922 length:951 start_codon:yes stop_codon:yes gene_type:complete